MGKKDKKKDKRLGVQQDYNDDEDHGGGIAIPDSSMPVDEDVEEDEAGTKGKAGTKGNKKANGGFSSLTVEDDEEDGNGSENDDKKTKETSKKKGGAAAATELKPKKKPVAHGSSSASDSDDVKIDLDLKPKKKPATATAAAASTAKKQQASGLGSDSDSDDDVKIDLDFKPKKKGAAVKGKEVDSKDNKKKNVLDGMKSLAIEDSDEDTNNTTAKPAAKSKKSKGATAVPAAGAAPSSSSSHQHHDDMISFGDSDHEDEEHDDKAKGSGKASAKDKKKDKGKDKKTVAVAADNGKYEMERQRGAAALKLEQEKQKARQEEEEIDALLAELDDKPAAGAATAAKGRKNKKKRKEAKDEEEDVEALLAALDARDAGGPDGGSEEKEKEKRPAKAGDAKGTKANNTKTAQKHHDEDDDDDDAGEHDVPGSKAKAANNMMSLLAIEGEDNDMNIDVDDADDADDANVKTKPAAAVEKPMTAAEKKKAKKKKGKAGDKQEDDLDAILAEFGVAAPPAPVTETTSAPAAAAAEEGGAETLEQLEAIPDNKLTAAQKKRLKKLRQKAKQDAGSAPDTASAASAVAPAAEPTDGAIHEAAGAAGAAGGKKKESAAVRKMREEIERRKAEQEKLAAAAVEAERLAQEQLKAEEEAARRAEEIKQKKKEAERLKREQLRKDGKLLTKSEKEKQRKAEQFRMQLIEQGKLPVGEETDEKKKVVYESKKKKPKQPGAASQEAAAVSAEPVVKVEHPIAVQERSVEVAQPAVEPTKEEHADDWDDEDWESKTQALVSVVKNTGDEEEEDINALLAKKAEEHLNSVITEKSVESAQPVQPAAKPVAKPAVSKTQPKKEDPVASQAKVEQESSEEEASSEEEEEDEEESEESSGEGSESGSGSESESGSEKTSSEESSSEYSSSEEEEVLDKQEVERRARVAAIKEKRIQMKEAALKARTKDKLRAPIVCILGHVDTGKTKILDRLRRTNVQGGEAGGITQQIGATFFPLDAIRKEVDRLNLKDFALRIPSLLIIDTPGHESFNNLRTRGSSMCDIAILVVDIMHGLEPQTIESINILRQRKNPFVVALNKIDRLFDWKVSKDCGSRESLSKQKPHVLAEFKDRLSQVTVAFAEQGLNTALYWENPDPRKYISLVPTSAVTGEGIPDLVMNLVNFSQTMLEPRLMFCNYLECTVIEVKVIEGYGTTVDVVLTGGELKEGDTIVVCGLDGPIVTKIRSLLTPHPMKEMRVKGQYLLHKRLEAAIGIKIAAEGLEKAVAGTQVYVPLKASDSDEIDFLKNEVMSDMHTILSSVNKTGLGVYVQASTLGSLEALLEFLRVSKIPVAGVNIGPVNRRDVMKCSTMLEKKKEFALILAFDVKVEKDAETLAKELEIKIFTADIIYHLFDQFTAYIDDIKKKKREAASSEAVFPCILKILPNCIFNQKSPIVLGVEVQEGILKVGTPIVILTGKTGVSAASAAEEVIPGMASTVGTLEIGRVQGIEVDKKAVPSAKAGQSVAVKIGGQDNILYGRHFDLENTLYSKLTRRSIDLLKEHFRDELGKEDWQTVIKIKKLLDIK